MWRPTQRRGRSSGKPRRPIRICDLQRGMSVTRAYVPPIDPDDRRSVSTGRMSVGASQATRGAAGGVSRSMRTAASIASAVMIAALMMHHWQIASMRASSTQVR